MRILETLIVVENRRQLDDLFASLPIESEKLLNFEVLRFQVSKDLNLMSYVFDISDDIQEGLLDHLQAHLDGLLVVTGSDLDSLSPEHAERLDDLTQRLDSLPTVIAIRSDDKSRYQISNIVKESGFFLSAKGRILFWHPSDKSSMRRILELLWSELHEEPA